MLLDAPSQKLLGILGCKEIVFSLLDSLLAGMAGFVSLTELTTKIVDRYCSMCVGHMRRVMLTLLGAL